MRSRSSKEKFDHRTYISRFTWRYGSTEMRQLFSELEYRRIWREIWYQLAKVQSTFGMVSQKELSEILKHKKQIDIMRSHEIERRVKHDLAAELKAYSEQCPKGGAKIHLGATSSDITDNADMMRIREALHIILQRLLCCLKLLRDNILKYANLPCIGWTHMQPAEPTTVGYRFANYAQDLILDIHCIESLIKNDIKGKGMKGVVGTSASYSGLLKGRVDPFEMERQVLERLNMTAFPVATQTYPRKVDFLLVAALASIAQSAHKFGFDIRLLQSPVFGEISEVFTEGQVGSSAMPFKRNPINSERMCSLARYVSSLIEAVWINAANALLERTLDDSASRQLIIPESFLATDEILVLYNKILEGIEVHASVIRTNLTRFGGFAGSEAILTRLVEKGADRQKMYKVLQRHSVDSWKNVLEGKQNPLPNLLKGDRDISSKLGPDEVDELLDPNKNLGNAPERCKKFVDECVDPLLREYGDIHLRRRDSEKKQSG